MTHPKFGDCLTTAQWANYLHPLALENEPWQQHLESCANCRDTLAELAGDQQWWQAVSEYLEPRDEPPVRPFVARVTQSVCALARDMASPTQFDPLCEFEISQFQQLLSPASHPELLGRIGRYELEQLVGRGGMGLVFRARDVELHRVVAVKTLAVHLIPVATARERFIREARASAGLLHPHVVPVYDVITDGPVPAIVMQFVAGPTLAAWLRTHGTMDWPSVLQIAQQLSDALLAAHSNGLIHRDVKPGNVLLEADGSRALLTDFGLVRALDEATLTRSGMLTGTPDYMSPEQARGETVTPSSDLFSLGALLYTMLTGNPPFRASDPMAVMNRICHARHRSLVATHPEVPVEISRLVDKLLAKDPKRRYTSAAELRSQLQRLSQAPLHLEAQRKLASHVGWLCGAVGLLLLAAVTAWSFWNSATAPPIPTMVVGPSTQQVQPSPPSSPSTAGFEDLRQLDQNLQQLNARVQNLADEFSSYEREPEFTRPLPGAGLDQPLRQLDQTLRELELEMSATETWHIASPP